MAAAPLDPSQTLLLFFRLLDERDYAGMARLLAPAGVWERQGEVLRRDTIEEALGRRSTTLRIHHLLTNVFAQPAGELEADVTAYMLVVRHDSGQATAGPSPLHGVDNIRTTRARMHHAAEGWRILRLASDPLSFQAGD